jgi:hypothetical protein
MGPYRFATIVDLAVNSQNPPVIRSSYASVSKDQEMEDGEI